VKLHRAFPGDPQERSGTCDWFFHDRARTNATKAKRRFREEAAFAKTTWQICFQRD
jgi:hypothetical protein